MSMIFQTFLRLIQKKLLQRDKENKNGYVNLVLEHQMFKTNMWIPAATNLELGCCSKVFTKSTFISSIQDATLSLGNLKQRYRNPLKRWSRRKKITSRALDTSSDADIHLGKNITHESQREARGSVTENIKKDVGERIQK